MARIKLTTKRQATFPPEVCHELGVKSGDSLELLPIRHENRTVWILAPAPRPKSKWIGSLARYAGSGKRPWTRGEHGDATARAMAREGGK